MGDRCRVYGMVEATGWDDFERITGVYKNTEQDCLPELVEFEMDEANYALGNECARAAEATLTFVLYNSAGDNYGKGMCISMGDGVLHSAELNECGWPMVPLQADHTVDLEALALAVAASKAEEFVRSLHKDVEKEVQE